MQCSEVPYPMGLLAKWARVTERRMLKTTTETNFVENVVAVGDNQGHWICVLQRVHTYAAAIVRQSLQHTKDIAIIG